MQFILPTWTRRAAMICVVAVISACATPAFDPNGAQTGVAPWEVAGQSRDGSAVVSGDVIWGGVILQVHHFENESEIEVLAYPLDSAQRPQPRAPSQGRFRIRIPGYVEAVDFPEGLFLSARGRLVGTRDGVIEKSRYVYPVITDAQIRRWPPGFQFDQRRWSFGVGVIL